MVTNQVAPRYPEPDLSPWSPCIPIETGPKPTQGQSPLHSTCSHIRSWQQTHSEPDPSPKSTWTQSEWAPNLLRASTVSIVSLVTNVVFHEIESEPDDLFWSQRWQSQEARSNSKLTPLTDSITTTQSGPEPRHRGLLLKAMRATTHSGHKPTPTLTQLQGYQGTKPSCLKLPRA